MTLALERFLAKHRKECRVVQPGKGRETVCPDRFKGEIDAIRRQNSLARRP